MKNGITYTDLFIQDFSTQVVHYNLHIINRLNIDELYTILST